MSVSKNKSLPLPRLFAHFIYGMIIQVLIFYTCNIWLAYLPIPSLYLLHHTYLFSLYLAYKLPSLKKLEQSEDISEIFSHLKDNVQKYAGFIPQHGFLYLAIFILLFHMPTLAGLLLTYIIFAQGYGHDQVDSLLHLPLMALCSLFAISSVIGWSLPLTLSIPPVIFILMFSSARIGHFKGLIQTLQDAKETFLTDYDTGDIYQKTTLALIGFSLITPYVQVIPFISCLYPYLTSDSVNLLKFTLSTLLVGEKSKDLLSPQDQKENLESAFEFTKASMASVFFGWGAEEKADNNEAPQQAASV